jgi:hypothetical protein
MAFVQGTSRMHHPRDGMDANAARQGRLRAMHSRAKDGPSMRRA